MWVHTHVHESAFVHVWKCVCGYQRPSLGAFLGHSLPYLKTVSLLEPGGLICLYLTDELQGSTRLHPSTVLGKQTHSTILDFSPGPKASELRWSCLCGRHFIDGTASAASEYRFYNLYLNRETYTRNENASWSREAQSSLLILVGSTAEHLSCN